MFFIEVNRVVVFCFSELDALVWGFPLHYPSLETAVEIPATCPKS